MTRLQELGVRTIVDLRSWDEITSFEAKRARALGMRYHRIPLGHLIGPRRATIDRVLEVLADPENWPVFVHCKRGCDRTGTVVACYRIANESWTAEEAIAEAMRLGMRIREFLKRRFIRRFYRRWAAQALDASGADGAPSPSTPPDARSSR